MDETKPKRKTHTSTAVKAKYNAKTYSMITLQLPKDLVAAFKEKCSAEGITQVSVIRPAIEAFVGDYKAQDNQ